MARARQIRGLACDEPFRTAAGKILWTRFEELMSFRDEVLKSKDPATAEDRATARGRSGAAVSARVVLLTTENVPRPSTVLTTLWAWGACLTQAEEEPIELHRLDPEAERRQLTRTARIRAERDPEASARALVELRQVAAAEKGNLLAPMRKALRAHCTIGEICEELRAEFSTYDAQRA